MKKRTHLSFVSLVMSMAILLTSVYICTPVLTVTAAGFEDQVGLEEIPYSPVIDSTNGTFAGYDYKTFDMYTEDEAKAAGVPEGYSGYVLKLTGDSEMGIGLNFTDRKIPVSTIESMTIRVWVASATKEVRLTNGGTNGGWIMQHAPSAKEAWIDITISADGTGFKTGHSFASFINNDDGTLGYIHLGFRYGGLAYVDSITVNMKEGGDQPDTPVSDHMSEIPYDKNSTYVPVVHGYKALSIYTEAQAAAAGVPEGYSGHVLALIGPTNLHAASVVLDMSSWQVQASEVKAIVVRLWTNAGTNNFRACVAGVGTRIVNEAPAGIEQWVEFVLPATGGNYINGGSFADFVNPDGTLGAFEMVIRMNNSTDTMAYIDSVTLIMNDPDHVHSYSEVVTAPTCTEDGYTTYTCSCGESYTEAGDAATGHTFADGACTACGVADPEAYVSEIPYAKDADFGFYQAYGADSILVYTEEGAAKAGVPAGYEGYVLSVTDAAGGGASFSVDLTAKNIQASHAESITLRVWVPTGAKQVRLSSATGWIIHIDPTAYGEWIELTVPAGKFASFTNADGTLGAFELVFRMNTAATQVYVDSITVNMRDPADIPRDYFADPLGREEIPYSRGNSAISGSAYWFDELKIYTEEQAAAANVPAGYSGHVMMLSGSSQVGIGLDFTDMNVPLSLIESMTLRVFVPDTITEVRLSGAVGDWLMRYEPETKNEWIEITLYADGTGFSGGQSFATFLNNEDGTLGQCHLCLRYPNGTLGTVYVDSITLDIKEDDGVAPVVQYKGEPTVKTSCGKPFKLAELVAFDEQEQRMIQPELTWSEGALDENGLLLMGTHTVTATFADHFGNASSVTLTVEVGEKDTEAPVIHFDVETVYATVGTRVDLAETLVITDNYDVIDPELTWSEGAVNAYNRLAVGTHTLTITATDLTGLASTWTVTFIVQDAADAPVDPTPVV